MASGYRVVLAFTPKSAMNPMSKFASVNSAGLVDSSVVRRGCCSSIQIESLCSYSVSSSSTVPCRSEGILSKTSCGMLLSVLRSVLEWDCWDYD